MTEQLSFSLSDTHLWVNRHYQRQDVHIYFSAIHKWMLLNALKTILFSVLVTYKKGILEFWVFMWDESLSSVNDSSPNSVTRLHRIRAKNGCEVHWFSDLILLPGKEVCSHMWVPFKSPPNSSLLISDNLLNFEVFFFL